MWNDPDFQKKLGPGSGLGGGSGLSSTSIVHEDPAELIQGGSSGERYHLTAAQVALVDSLSGDLIDQIEQGRRIYEPMMANDGTLVLNGDNDLMMAWGGEYAT